MRMRSTTSCYVIAAASLLFAGCMGSPRNGQRIGSKRESVFLQGLSIQPNVHVAVKALAFTTNRWEDLAQGTTSAATAALDPAGYAWYTYEGYFYPPTSERFWRMASTLNGQRRIEANLAAYTAGEGYLTTFNVDADTCVVNNWASGLFTVMGNCGSGITGALINVNCGKANQDCCIANKNPVSERCDNGRLCDSAGRCTIASGNLGQPCNGNGSCNGAPLACIAGTCRDALIEALPVVTLDLRLTTCNDSGWLANNSGSRLWVNVGGSDFYVEVPGSELGRSTVNTFGISPKGVRRLRDITKLDIGIYNRDLCLNRVELLANEQVVFSRTFSPTEFMRATYPYHEDHLTFTQDELRIDWTARPQATHCQAPPQFSGTALQRKFTGLLGNALITATGVKGDFDGDGGKLSLTRRDASTVRANTRFAATKFVNGIGNVTVDVDARFDASITCTNGTISANTSSIRVVDVDGPFGYDVINILSSGVIELLIEGTAQSALNDKLGGLQDSLGALVSGLPGCPGLNFDTATTPPNLLITIPGGVPHASVNVCLLP